MKEQEHILLANNNLNKLWSPVLLKIFMIHTECSANSLFFIVLGLRQNPGA